MVASTSIPWRRNGANSWNDLVQRVNAVLQDPPSGCDPIAPLPEVDVCHKWIAQNITDMQDALKQACDTNEFTPVAPCDKWKKFIIDEIEVAIVTGFCDCGVCIPPCDNEAGDVETFITSIVATECSELLDFRCDEEISNSIILWDEYNAFKAEYIIDFTLYCKLVEEVDDLQEELDDLTEQRDIECTANPGSALCASLTIQVDDKQIELDDKTAERDAALVVSDASKASMLATAAETVINAENAIHDAPPLMDLVLTDPEPWTNWECDDPLKIPECAGLGPCEVKWKLQERIFELIEIGSFPGCLVTGPHPGAPFDWETVLEGEYTIEGTIAVKNFNDCLQQEIFLCRSSFCDGACPQTDCVFSTSKTTEYRQVTEFPAEREPVECETGEPCTP